MIEVLAWFLLAGLVAAYIQILDHLDRRRLERLERWGVRRAP